MLTIVSAAEMGEIDRTCGVPSLELMENAATAVADAVEERLRSEEGTKEVLVLTGKGNNAGDGFAAARILSERGISVSILNFFDETALSGDALTNFARLKETSVSLRGPDLSVLEERRFGVAVDALLGTGLRSEPLKEPWSSAVSGLNRARREGRVGFVVAVDIPSGISADTGRECGVSVGADLTVTFGRAKRGHFLFPGRLRTGRLIVNDIGIPPERFSGCRGEVLTDEDMRRLLPTRPRTAHKGSARLVIIGGSRGLTGAASLAALAALKAGAGYVTIGGPEGNEAAMVPIEAVRVSLPGVEGRFGPESEEPALNLTLKSHATILGPGLGRGEAERALSIHLCRLVPVPMVVDADALHQISPDLLRSAHAPRVVTPHPGEFSALFGGTVETIEEDRIGRALDAAKRCRQVVVLKGPATVVAEPSGRYRINPTGNQLLATCGSGDVLSGIIGALLAQGMDAFEAASVGVFLHGRCAEEYAEPVGLTAGEIAELIPRAWGRIVP